MTNAKEITRAATMLQAGGKLDLIKLDLASLKSVYACANELLSSGQKFDVIITQITGSGMQVVDF
jgi:hypothetical protein